MAKVRFMKPEEIEQETLFLIGAYGKQFSSVETPPIPVEEILQSHLGLGLELDDLPAKLGVPEAIGATWIKEKRVVIDESLDPDTNPKKEGRYRFTIAHEIGHWMLHRKLILAEKSQGSMFGKTEEKPSVVCRAVSTKDSMEWQADSFAGYLLMPEAMVFEEWRKLRGNHSPYIAVEEMAVCAKAWGLAEDARPTIDISRDMAQVFKVSGQAMQIRLTRLGLILTEDPGPSLFES